jgi:hypothetical protein
MRKPNKASARGLMAVPRAIQQQPDYCTEVSDEYIEALRNRVNREKPVGFKLTPISEPGW